MTVATEAALEDEPPEFYQIVPPPPVRNRLATLIAGRLIATPYGTPTL